jgi:hypothetical protein
MSRESVMRQVCERRETGRKLGMKEPYKERSSEPLWPRVLRYASRGAHRSVDSGTGRPGHRAAKRTYRTPTLYICGEGNRRHGDRSRVMTSTGVVKDPVHVGKLSEREPGDLRRV